MLRNLLVLGTGPRADRLISHVSKDPHWDYNVCGLLVTSAGKPRKEVAGVPVLGGLDDLAKVLERYDIGETILTEPSLERDKILDIIRECEKIGMEVPDFAAFCLAAMCTISDELGL